MGVAEGEQGHQSPAGAMPPPHLLSAFSLILNNWYLDVQAGKLKTLIDEMSKMDGNKTPITAFSHLSSQLLH